MKKKDNKYRLTTNEVVTPEVSLGELVRGTFVKRDNRFRVQVEVGGTVVAAHLANPGRLRELLIPGHEVWLEPALRPQRKTPYTLALIAHQGEYVSVNSQLPNRLIGQALTRREIPCLTDYTVVKREVFLGESRLDFRLGGADPLCWVEVKSVTLVVDGGARFPDAPTARGWRHLHALMRAVHDGMRAVALFVVQRSDADSFAPNDHTDPAFADALRQAHRTGVEIYALRCAVSPMAIRLSDFIPVYLSTA